MSWTDEELDKLFSDSAGDMTFEYKKEYFKDIEKHIKSNMGTADPELAKL